MEPTKHVTIPDLIKRLDDMFIKERILKNEILKSCRDLEQLQEDIELLQNMIMHQSNKMARGR